MLKQIVVDKVMARQMWKLGSRNPPYLTMMWMAICRMLKTTPCN